MYTSVLLNVKEIRIEISESLYSHILKSVSEHEDITVLWNQGVKAGRF
jgi:hypothetical protein